MENKDEKKSRKIFVLDTSVVIHDHECWEKFEKNDIVIPYTVIEELDRQKTADGAKGYAVREFIRFLDSLEREVYTDGVSLGENLGTLKITKKSDSDPHEKKADTRIINSARHIAENSEGKIVVLVTKDRMMRVQAKQHKEIETEDYSYDSVEIEIGRASGRGRRVWDGCSTGVAAAL